MPIRWDEKQRVTLLLKLIEHNPTTLTKTNAETIAASWPGNEKPTGRAITEQIAKLKKQIAAQNPNWSTPRRSGGGRSSSTGKLVTPKTPGRSGGAKRSAASAKGDTSSNKKRKIGGAKGKKGANDDEEVETPETLSSSAADDDDDDDGDAETEEGADGAEVEKNAGAKRKVLPARSKSRVASYVAEADSTGEDAGAKTPDTDEDAEYSLPKVEKDDAKKALGARRRLFEAEIEEREEADNELRDEQRDSEEESWTTRRTFYSAVEEAV